MWGAGGVEEGAFFIFKWCVGIKGFVSLYRSGLFEITTVPLFIDSAVEKAQFKKWDNEDNGTIKNILSVMYNGSVLNSSTQCKVKEQKCFEKMLGRCRNKLRK